MSTTNTIDIIRQLRVAMRSINVPFESATGSTVRHLLVLDAVQNGEMIQSRISEMTGIDRTTITNTILILEQRGFVKVKTPPEDRRAKLVSITAEGRKTLKKLKSTLENLFGPQFGMSDQKADTLVSLLKDVAECRVS